uniref:Uncharacterized protein n=1 Tax=Siphoviridae sp. ctxvK3 TaxID=2827975 RepID=A0A8S5SG84_9CAUD|nr:MAG TPA: hypothetical protein [Siphoviridae sp. ctxvK3]
MIHQLWSFLYSIISLQNLLALNTLQLLLLVDKVVQTEFQFHNKSSLE